MQLFYDDTQLKNLILRHAGARAAEKAATCAPMAVLVRGRFNVDVTKRRIERSIDETAASQGPV